MAYIPYGQQPAAASYTPYGYSNPTGAALGSMGTMNAGSGVAGVSGVYGDPSSPEGELSKGILKAFSTSGYANEPPLLEELGINFGHITQKTLVVLNPLRAIDEHIMDDSDAAGPLLFFVLFGVFLLLGGKVNFGYIYGMGLVGTFCQYGVLNLMAMRHIDFTRTMSVLGYCLLPLVAVSAVGVVHSLNNLLGYLLGLFAISWCTYSSSAIFVTYLHLTQMRALVAYPLALFYGIFSLMTLFSDTSVSS